MYLEYALKNTQWQVVPMEKISPMKQIIQRICRDKLNILILLIGVVVVPSIFFMQAYNFKVQSFLLGVLYYQFVHL